jgi:hypothetical protein
MAPEKVKSKTANQAIRSVRSGTFCMRAGEFRQKLLAMSDLERSQTYEFAGEPSVPVQNYRATLRLMPVVDGDRAFVEWWATFDCGPERRGERVAFFRDAFATWLGSLRRHLESRQR